MNKFPLLIIILGLSFSGLIGSASVIATAASEQKEKPLSQEEVPLIRYQLTNGLKIVLCPLPSRPLLSVKLCLDNSFRDEPREHPGIRYVSTQFIQQYQWDAIIEKTMVGWSDPVNYAPTFSCKDVIVPSRYYAQAIDLVGQMLERMTPQADKKALAHLHQLKARHPHQRVRPPKTSLIHSESFTDPGARNGPQKRPHFLRLTDDAYLQFRQKHIQPKRATLILSGAFPLEETKKLIQEKLAVIPNHEKTQPAHLLKTFRSGRIVKLPHQQQSLLHINYPLPSTLGNVESECLGEILQKFLQKTLPATLLMGKVHVATDAEKGVRLLKITLPGDPKKLLLAFDKARPQFAEFLKQTDVSPFLKTFLQKYLPQKMRTLYGKSWSLGVNKEKLGFGGKNAWQEVRLIQQLTTQDFLQWVDPLFQGKGGRTVILRSPQYAKKEIVSEGTPLNLWKDQPRATPSPPILQNTSHWDRLYSPHVKTVAQGKVIVERDPSEFSYQLRAFYPLGTLEKNTLHYIDTLKKTWPPFLPRTALKTSPDHLLLEWRSWDPLVFQKKLPELVHWLNSAPHSEKELSATSPFSFQFNGPRPSWILALSLPEMWPELGTLSPQGKVWKSLPPPEGSDFSALNKESLSTTCTLNLSQEDPVLRQALLIYLHAWLERKKPHRYGPFTLTLPKREHFFSEFKPFVTPQGFYLTLDFPDQKAFLKEAQTGTLFTQALKKETFEKLRAWAQLTWLQRTTGFRTSSATRNHHLDSLWMSWLWGNGDPHFCDQVTTAIDQMTPEKLAQETTRWFSHLVIDFSPEQQ